MWWCVCWCYILYILYIITLYYSIIYIIIHYIIILYYTYILLYTYLYSSSSSSFYSLLLFPSLLFFSSNPSPPLTPSTSSSPPFLPSSFILYLSILIYTYLYSISSLLPNIPPRTFYRRHVSSGVVLFVWCLSWCGVLLCFELVMRVGVIFCYQYIIYYILLYITIIIILYTLLPLYSSFSSSHLLSSPSHLPYQSHLPYPFLIHSIPVDTYILLLIFHLFHTSSLPIYHPNPSSDSFYTCRDLHTLTYIPIIFPPTILTPHVLSERLVERLWCVFGLVCICV